MKNETEYVERQENMMKSAVELSVNKAIRERAQKEMKYSNPENVKAAYANIFGLSK